MSTPEDRPEDSPEHPATSPETSPDAGPEDTADWQRLDPRMLLVHPIREVMRFLPVLLGIFIAGNASGSRDGTPWELLGVAIPVALGLLRYLTTRFRITAGRIELRRGLLNRHVLSTPRDRVRTVDLTASLIQRALGLTTVRIGTGTASTDGDDRLDLDGLPVDRARRLREELLHASTLAPDPTSPIENERVVLRFDASWARFAPLTGAGLFIGLGVLGAGFQLLVTLGGTADLRSDDLFDGSMIAAWWLGVAFLALAFLVVVSGLAMLGYLITNWGFTLSHTRADGSWHLRRGLLTTRETSLDDDRLSGVSLAEPIGLRLGGGAHLGAIVTGLDRGQQGSSTLVPSAPARVVTATARGILGTAGPVDVVLTGHGPRARLRRYVRALTGAGVVVAAVILLVVVLHAPVSLLVLALLAPIAAIALAADRTRSLGHATGRGVRRVALGQSGPSSRDARCRGRDRLELRGHLVPTTSRAAHPRRHHGGWAPGRPCARHPRGGGRRPRARRCPRVGQPVPERLDPCRFGPCSRRCSWPTVVRSQSAPFGRPMRSGPARSRSSRTRTAGPSTG